MIAVTSGIARLVHCWGEREGFAMSIAIAVVVVAVGIGTVATLITTNKGAVTPRLWRRSSRHGIRRAY